MNTDSALDEAIIHPELRHIKFFNGRLLTGGDLEEEQTAQHAHSRHLGEAIGQGVAFGLLVTPADDSPPDGPVVAVTAGLAVNHAGQTLRLECDQRIALIRPADPAARDACVFTDCDPAGSGVTLASGTGYYILTIGPASRPDGKAPVSGLGNTTAICNSRYSAEGVKFSVYRLNHAANTTARARSLLAQACFGLAPDISEDPWPASLPGKYGWETLMPAGFDGEYNVPLAVFEWTSASRIEFIKCWPVRRRMVRRSTVEEWDYFTSERRAAEGEAMFLDFQEDLAAVGASAFAGDGFAFLPPGGVLPAGASQDKISGARRLSENESTGPWKTFLGPLAPPFVTPIDASLWPRLLRDTFTREPVAVPAQDAKTLDVPSFAAIKVYAVPERDERLFARSPLGRLRIFPGQASESGNDWNAVMIVILRDANGVVRFFESSNEETGPLIADDLPGGNAELWFVYPATIGYTAGIDSNNPVQKSSEKEEAATAKKKSRSKKSARAAAPPAAESQAETLFQDSPPREFNSDSMATLIQQLKPHVTARIVNGRTTDIQIPSRRLEFRQQEKG